jgi:hypothetical protein
MNIPVLDPHEVGANGVDNLVAHAEQICAYEERRIELTNQGPIASLVQEHQHLSGEENRIVTQLRDAPPLGDRMRLLRRAIFCWTLTMVLAASGFALTILTLEPFLPGSKTWLYAIGVSILTPFLIDEVLSHWPVLVKFLTPFAAAAGLGGVMLFAAIRGDIFGEELRQNQGSAVVIDDANAPSQMPQSDFYGSTVPLLRIAFLLIAFSIELGAGIALWEARRSRTNDAEDWNALRRELRQIRSRYGAILREAIDLRNAPAIFAASYRRDFYRAMLTNAVKKSLAKVLLFAFGVVAIGCPMAHAQENENLVIAIDLTASVAGAGPDGKSEFQKDIEGVTHVLAQVPAGARVTVMGITDHSFTQPYILMRARIATDPGYFGERLAAARNQLVRVWKTRSARLEPNFRHTDILGALLLSSQIFREVSTSNQRLLIIFSDMRQDTPELDLETVAKVPLYSGVADRCGPLPDLRGVRVEIVGAGGAGHSTAYWGELQAFWVDYFHCSGADIEKYSSLREIVAGP